MTLAVQEAQVPPVVKIVEQKPLPPRDPNLPAWKADIQNQARTMVIAKWGDGEWGAFKTLIDNESGWNVNALNKSSGACGLAQALPCSKMAPYGNDYRTNHIPQLKFAMAYIEGRYGTPSKALSVWKSRSPHWY